MRQIWFKTLVGGLAVAGLGVAAALSPKQVEAYQGAFTPAGIFITVGNPPDGVNVRSGPNSVSYGSPIGHLNPGDTAPAIGRTPKGEWIKIVFPSGPNGTGWVYSANVTVSPGELPVVEAPPTPGPLATSTIDPTLAAVFNIRPTPTRLPTFTPPPPLTVPHFTEENNGKGSGLTGIFIFSLGLIGVVGLLISYVLRK